MIICIILLLLGLMAQYFNSAIDRQKYTFRKVNGLIKINGVDPYFISTKCRDSGENKLLLGK